MADRARFAVGGPVLDIRHLRYFVAVCEERSFRKAAERLNVSHAPVNRQIHDLEHELGAKLVIATPQGLVLTEAGDALLPRARGILASVADAARAVTVIAHGEKGILRIGHSHGQLDPSLPVVVEAFCRDHPAVEVELIPLHAREQFRLLVQGDLDIGYCAVRGQHVDDALHFETFSTSPVGVVLAASRDIAPDRRVDLADLADDTFLMLRPGEVPQYAAWMQGIFDRCAFTPTQVRQVKSIQSMIALALAGKGVALLARRSIPRDLMHGFHLLAGDVPPMDYFVAWRRHDTTRATARFLDLLRAQVGRH